MHAIVNGGTAPKGRIFVSGAKNSATRLLAASLLSDEAVTLSNFPNDLVDVRHKVKFAQKLGTAIEESSDHNTIQIMAKDLASRQLARDELDVPIRTTYLLAAAQLLRSGIARVPYPGGCPIGTGKAGGRGYDLHIMVWEKLGCLVTEEPDHILIEAKTGLRGDEIDFPISTVGGTENAILCASVAKGTTEIRNAYLTPEVLDLIKLMRQMGADIEIYGASRIRITGKAEPLTGTHMQVMSDRIEALTWIVYAAISGGSITVENVPFSSMEIPLIHLKQAGIDFLSNSNSVHINQSVLTSGVIQPFELACGSHPGIISDMQAFFVLLGMKADGTSRIYDYRYPDRIAFIAELNKLNEGRMVDASPGKITTYGNATFRPARVNSTDLRGSMAVLLAALCANGSSRIDNVHMALRGYSKLEEKLAQLGQELTVVDDRTL